METHKKRSVARHGRHDSLDTALRRGGTDRISSLAPRRFSLRDRRWACFRSATGLMVRRALGLCLSTLGEPLDSRPAEFCQPFSRENRFDPRRWEYETTTT